MVVESAPTRLRVRPAAALLAIAVGAQVAYPLVHGEVRDRVTDAVVVLLAATSLAHAWTSRGRRVALGLAAATIPLGFAVEVLGVHTGWPFGHYAYANSLGPRLFGVPLVIAFAWTMLAWPAAVVARRLAPFFAARVAVGAWALAAWDLFLDPQMVAAGHWRWADPSPHLPGVPTVPLSDYAGWLLAATVISWLLQRILEREENPPLSQDIEPVALYVWTWASSTLALLAFLGLPFAAVYGAVGMGVVAVPLLRRLW